MTKVVHYINQFFAGIGGEDAAGSSPVRVEGAVGPGRRLQQLLGDDLEIVATVHCGDDYASGSSDAIEEILALVRQDDPDLLIAGPSFTSGRYGLACARVAAAATQEGITSLAAMHEENPGVDEAGGATVVRSGVAAREMGPSLETLAAAAAIVASGEPLTSEQGRLGRPRRQVVRAERPAAARAVDLALARLGGDLEATEVPLPRFEQVTPAAPVDDVGQAVVALVTEGALVPEGNPGRLESARATRWLRYSLDGVEALAPDQYGSVHGGFSTVWANEDPHRIVPLDIARELEAEGAIGRLHGEYLVTAGNGTSVANARRFGIEWAADLRRSEVRAAILTST
ncbi:MAG: glycine/betaine/sarcosine/D-proline family reductase selenoprotein B [Actinobacteria bacterium]|nr:glycine/betaine/sarcosine/D-proline family reductase selenoprotein B [Actinomycetota bacterium]